jgi:hypothetical protein
MGSLSSITMWVSRGEGGHPWGDFVRDTAALASLHSDFLGGFRIIAEPRNPGDSRQPEPDTVKIF